MKVFVKKDELKTALNQARSEKKTIGFVPTMGALHQGHIKLVERSVGENDLTVVSIFVNPIQFNNPDDLKKYPRTIEKDINLLAQTGCNFIFTPEVKEMYPDQTTEKYSFGSLEEVMEGKFRPGHFNGVAVVVKRFFDIISPNNAYFGEKDFQQLAVIKRLVHDCQIPVNIVPCETIRELDGLAMSSRNMRLTNEQRKSAAQISEKLRKLSSLLNNNPVNTSILLITNELNNIEHLKVEYLEIVDDTSLLSVKNLRESKGIVACIAVFCGEVRLIDNIRIK
ncbi:MAG: pantoate--beta-alanine ligase [Bacteroidetes bacterium GWF2_38_335]|nr:MAG: pantoate--beta-alanine ligase [Bacteroidetes bacterium GWF2_38_335]OFY76992.1 MAG: pantoate--beta-alanine ligase [Bacteroidetes bacterium RIFOXYA12_FULL_38_20]HBS86848.1 pantoate--beta-alanine ligase [Bacteroidales bacterium]